MQTNKLKEMNQALYAHMNNKRKMKKKKHKLQRGVLNVKNRSMYTKCQGSTKD
jgi:hypothetical protein